MLTVVLRPLPVFRLPRYWGLGGLFLLLAFAAPGVRAQTILAASTFNTNADGWTVVDLPASSGLTVPITQDGGPYTPTYNSSGGNPSGDISIVDPDGKYYFWYAPAKFLGDQSAAYGGKLSFDLKDTDGGTSANATDQSLILVGNEITLTHALTTPSTTTFTNYVVRLGPAGFTNLNTGSPASVADIKSVLGSLQSLYIQGDFESSTDTGSLDNVILNAPPSSQATHYVSPSGKDTNPGTFSKPFKTIQKGINASYNGDTVTLKDGTYTGPGDVRLDFGGANLTVNSINGASKAIIDCQGTVYAFNFHSGETAAVVDGLTIKNGYNNYGAVFIASSSTVTLMNCMLIGNTAYDYGGAIYNAGTVTLTGCTLTGNVCNQGGNNFGGGIYNNGTATLTGCTLSKNIAGNGGGGAYNSNGVMLFTHCAFTENVSDYGGGGGLENIGSATLTDCTFTKNMTTFSGGGAIVNSAYTDFYSALTLTRCTFSGNKSAGSGGAVISDAGNATLATLADCTFVGNEADSDGGGFYNASPAIFTNCSFIGNRANGGGNGGGICNAATNAYKVKLTNCVFSGNSAVEGNGGGIYNGNSNSSQSNVTLQFCSFAGNSSGGGSAHGGALENDGTASIIDCILYGDTAPTGAEIGAAATANGGTPVTTVTYSDIQGGYSGMGNIDAKPLYARSPDPAADPPNYGDLHLNPGSPCVGKGVAVSGVTKDADGLTRKNPPTLGAYEVLPRLATLSPALAAAGGPAFTLTVTGLDFTSASYVKWNGMALTTHFVSFTQMTASVPAALIASVGTAAVVVVTPGVATSNSRTFTVSPVPVLTSLSPASATAGGPAFTLTVIGTGFVASSLIKFGGATQPTTYVSGTTLTASIPASLITTAGTVAVTVVTPGVAASGSKTFTVNAASSLPVLSSISPTARTAGGGSFVLTANGSSFISGSIIKWNGATQTTTFVSSTKLTANIPASLIASAGTASITVTTPHVGTSGSKTLTINP